MDGPQAAGCAEGSEAGEDPEAGPTQANKVIRASLRTAASLGSLRECGHLEVPSAGDLLSGARGSAASWPCTDHDPWPARFDAGPQVAGGEEGGAEVELALLPGRPRQQVTCRWLGCWAVRHPGAVLTLSDWTRCGRWRGRRR